MGWRAEPLSPSRPRPALWFFEGEALAGRAGVPLDLWGDSLAPLYELSFASGDDALGVIRDRRSW